MTLAVGQFPELLVGDYFRDGGCPLPDGAIAIQWRHSLNVGYYPIKPQ